MREGGEWGGEGEEGEGEGGEWGGEGKRGQKEFDKKNKQTNK